MKKYTNLTIISISLIIIASLLIYMIAFKPKDEKQSSRQETSTSITSSIHQDLVDFSLKGADGSTLRLKDIKDKPIFLVEWASWCPHCQKELPIIETLYQKYKDKIHFVMVDATDGQKETSESAKLFVETKKFTFPYYLDDQLSFAKQMNITEVPTMLFSTKNGHIQKIVKEDISQTDLEKELVSLLSHQ